MQHNLDALSVSQLKEQCELAQTQLDQISASIEDLGPLQQVLYANSIMGLSRQIQQTPEVALLAISYTYTAMMSQIAENLLKEKLKDLPTSPTVQ